MVSKRPSEQRARRALELVARGSWAATNFIAWNGGASASVQEPSDARTISDRDESRHSEQQQARNKVEGDEYTGFVIPNVRQMKFEELSLSNNLLSSLDFGARTPVGKHSSCLSGRLRRSKIFSGGESF